MKSARIAVLLLVATLGLLCRNLPAVAADSDLVGAWVIKVPSHDPSGAPCPFVPQHMDIHKDHTVTMSNFGSQRLPYKTELSPAERRAHEARNPAFKGKQLLLIKPNPAMAWEATPMAYAFKVKTDEMTLELAGWSPAVYRRKQPR